MKNLSSSIIPIIDITVKKSNAQYNLLRNLSWILPLKIRCFDVKTAFLQKQIELLNTKNSIRNRKSIKATLYILKRKYMFRNLFSSLNTEKSNTKPNILQGLLIATKVMQAYWCRESSQIIILIQTEQDYNAITILFGAESIYLYLDTLEINETLPKGSCCVLMK